EDVTCLHLVAVVLEAAVSVFWHLRAAARQGLYDLLFRPPLAHLLGGDELGVLCRGVHPPFVVFDPHGSVLPLLAEPLALLALHNRPSTVVGIHHLVADLVQADSLSRLVTKAPAARSPRHEDDRVPEIPGKGGRLQAFSEKLPARSEIFCFTPWV